MDKQYIIFSVNDSRYAVEALLVQEIFLLPELTPVVEAPPDIVGMINLRGEILPIMDLHLRFGYRFQEYRLTDSVIVLVYQGFRVGIIVNQVHDVQNISSDEITAGLSYGREVTNNSHFVAGVAKVKADIVILLNPENLIRYVETRHIASDKALIQEEATETKNTQAYNVPNLFAEHRIFCPNATPEERAIFRERAESLMRQAESQDFSGNCPMVVIGLNGEYFGLDLGVVREFIDICKVTPIPCCQNHIIGNMNLRGEILTLVDIRRVLIPSANVGSAKTAMVVQIDDLVAGVTVDEVFDVMYLNPLEMMSIPAAVHSMKDEFLLGTVHYREKIMAILDMPKILSQGGLMVDEEV